MIDEKIRRIYNMTDASLCMFVSNIRSTLYRDITDLSQFGLTVGKIESLEALGNQFEVFPQDVYYSASVWGATEEKDLLIRNMMNSVRNMALRCQLKWGKNSFQEKSLRITGMNKFTDNSLIILARRVHEQMTIFLPELVDEGLTQAMLDEFEILIESAETALNRQKNLIDERDKKTFERIKMGNDLYILLNKYCDIGKMIYANTNPAKYNDYLIYRRQKRKKKKPEVEEVKEIEKVD